jgi:hypothetical protein
MNDFSVIREVHVVSCLNTQILRKNIFVWFVFVCKIMKSWKSGTGFSLDIFDHQYFFWELQRNYKIFNLHSSFSNYNCTA